MPDLTMLPRLSASVSRTLAKPTSVRPAIQKRFFGDPHADTGAEAVGTDFELGVIIPSLPLDR
jgi:hypothetical protein